MAVLHDGFRTGATRHCGECYIDYLFVLIADIIASRPSVQAGGTEPAADAPASTSAADASPGTTYPPPSAARVPANADAGVDAVPTAAVTPTVAAVEVGDGGADLDTKDNTGADVSAVYCGSVAMSASNLRRVCLLVCAWGRWRCVATSYLGVGLTSCACSTAHR